MNCKRLKYTDKYLPWKTDSNEIARWQSMDKIRMKLIYELYYFDWIVTVRKEITAVAQLT